MNLLKLAFHLIFHSLDTELQSIDLCEHRLIFEKEAVIFSLNALFILVKQIKILDFLM